MWSANAQAETMGILMTEFGFTLCLDPGEKGPDCRAASFGRFDSGFAAAREARPLEVRLWRCGRIGIGSHR
jgi:hypothetical protein